MKALLLSLLASQCAVHAQTEEKPLPVDRSDITVRGVFTSELPDLGAKHSFRLTWHPHLGDLTKHDYLRAGMGLKYVLSSRTELRAATTGYFSHGLKDTGFFEEVGFGSLQFEAKYRFKQKLFGKWDSAIGGRYFTPINDPPVYFTDGLERWSAFSTFARSLEQRPDIRVFWGLGVDLLREESPFGRISKNALREDNHSLSGGFILDRGRIHYTLETKWITTRLLSSKEEDVLEVRPGIVWELGRPRENGKARWLLGLSLSSSFGPDGDNYSVGTRLRGDFDLKRLFRRGEDKEEE